MTQHDNPAKWINILQTLLASQILLAMDRSESDEWVKHL
jgi:hypothetical protein